MSNPSDDVLESILLARMEMAASVAAVLSAGNDDTSDLATNIAYAMIDRDNSVRGNRPCHKQLTWSDLKLILVSSLTVCLEELEKT